MYAELDHLRTVFICNASRVCRIKFDSEFPKYRRLILSDVANEEVSEGKAVASIRYSRDIKRKKVIPLNCIMLSRSRSHQIMKFVLSSSLMSPE